MNLLGFLVGIFCICLIFLTLEVGEPYTARAFWFVLGKLARVQFIRRAVHRG